MKLIRFFKNPCNLYFLVWIVQIVHEPLEIYGNSVSVLVLFGLFVWSLYYLFITFLKYNVPPFLKVWTLLFVLFTIHAFIYMMFPPSGVAPSSTRRFLIEHWTSLLPIYPFFVFSMKKQLDRDVLRKWVIPFVVMGVINYYYGESYAYSLLEGAEVVGVTNNMGYSIAFVLPFLFFIKDKPIFQYVGVAVMLGYTFLALKRGAIVIAIIATVFVLRDSVQTIKRNKKIIYCLFTIFIFAVYYFIQYQMSSNEYFLERVIQTQEGDTSARDDIYMDLIRYIINDMDVFQYIFGLGANGSKKAIGVEGHNDWLEIMVSMGIIGFYSFFLLWKRSLWQYKQITDKEKKLLFGIVVLMIFIRTFSSMAIRDIYITSTSILGFCLASIAKKRTEYH